MKLLVLSTPPVPYHGWGRYTREMLIALSAHGVDITLITSRDAPTDPGLPLADYVRLLPSLIHPVQLNNARILSCAPTIRRFAARADVVHVMAEPYGLAALWQPKPLIVTAHGTYIPRSVARRGLGALYRHVYQHSQIVCVSHYTENQVQIALPKAHTRVIINGVDVARFDQTAPLPDKFGASAIILTVGQVKARKGYHIMVEAMIRIHEVLPNVHAVFIGDTSDTAYCDQLRQQIATNGLGDYVHLLGSVSDEVLRGWYGAADIFALPAMNTGGKFEGFGLVYLEASAAGLPTIGTRGCGAEDAILNGESGLLIDQRDASGMADALLRLLDNRALRVQMGTAGRAFAKKHTWSQIAAQMLDVYREAIHA